uniref:HAT C-terminal dimerisation domain-containing protein n=1 Tax=Latimeria chalumnae TaxID=7897 RepID=H3BEE8_LATCH
KKWLCGSASKKSLFCFPCLLFGGEVAWTQTGVNDLKHLSEKKKDESCKCHLDNSIKLAMFGSVNIATQLDESYRVGIRKHNEEVDKNRYILSKLIDRVQFCGAFELALRGHDETESSLNPGVFRGLVDLVSSIDSAMEKHEKSATVFKDTSKTIQNELLDVTRDFIIQQLRNTEYVAIQARGAQEGVEMIYRPIDHQEEAVVPLFFAKTTFTLYIIATLPGGDDKCFHWNFNIQTVNIYREDLLECFKPIECSTAFESSTIREARGFIRILFFLSFFLSCPNVDVLYSQLQKVYVERVTTEFVSSINKVRESIEDLGSKLPDEFEFPTWHAGRCRTKIVRAKERFAFTKHLVRAKLLQSDLFERRSQRFPLQTFTDTVQAYPMLNKERLHAELSVIYGKPEFHGASGAMALFRLFLENNQQDTVKLLRILITTPMTTVECERCFSTLKKIKTFLRNAMNQDRLSTLAMMSMEKQLAQEIPDFNKRTIEKFAA